MASTTVTLFQKKNTQYEMLSLYLHTMSWSIVSPYAKYSMKLTLDSTFLNDAMRNEIYDALAEWRDNGANISLKDRGMYSVRVNSTVMKREVTARTMWHSQYEVTVTFNSLYCWYLRDRVCMYIVNVERCVCVFLIAMFLYFGSMMLVKFPILKNMLEIGVLYTIVLGIYAYANCVNCHSFRYATLHEFGHVLGVGHVNGLNAKCGCDKSTPCQCSSCEFAVMQTNTQKHRGDDCLDLDDVHGIQSRHESNVCSANVHCRLDWHFLYTHIPFYICACAASLYMLFCYIKTKLFKYRRTKVLPKNECVESIAT